MKGFRNENYQGFCFVHRAQYNNRIDLLCWEVKSPLLQSTMSFSRDQALIIISTAVIFAGMSFSYSFVGFYSPQAKTIKRFDTFSSLTPQEIGGHFLFGYVAGLPFRKLSIAVLCGLMALALDTDHILNAAGFQAQGRMSHSIPFIIIASFLVGTITNIIFNYSGQDDQRSLKPSVSRTNKRESFVDYLKSHVLGKHLQKIFSQFLVVSAAAVISHIGYDTFVDNHASFPLLAPLLYTEFHIPQIYGIPIEGTAILLVYIWRMAV